MSEPKRPGAINSQTIIPPTRTRTAAAPAFDVRTIIPPNKPRSIGAPDASANSRALSAARQVAGTVSGRSRVHADKRPRDPKTRLAQWETDVRVMLAVTEFVSQFKIVPTQGGAGIVAHFGSFQTAELVGPTEAELRKSPDGLKAVLRLGTAAKREPLLDEIQVHAFDIEGLFASVCEIDSARRPVTTEVSRVLMEIATVVVQRIKDALDVPRPSELSNEVSPVIPVPGHASFPSGHAVQATVLACMLSQLPSDRTLPEKALRKLAQRIADLRVIAGVHYPLDSQAGVALGLALRSALLASLAGGPKAPMSLPTFSLLWSAAALEPAP